MLFLPNTPRYLRLHSVYLATMFGAIPACGVASCEVLVKDFLDCILYTGREILVQARKWKYLPPMKLRTLQCQLGANHVCVILYYSDMILHFWQVFDTVKIICKMYFL